uniref:Calmodulin binding transcription activator 2 n=1 Tax=Seriola lalandi dorsalis TaxID=1841481 RepID=A0A3B4X9V4_SERLL
MTSVSTENKGQRKVFLPNKLLECLPRSSGLPNERLRWNTNEEIASYLISFDRHDEWLSCTLKTRPKNGSIILYNRKKVKYRKDGYCWKKRKDGKTTREDHMKLKVQGMEVMSACHHQLMLLLTLCVCVTEPRHCAGPLPERAIPGGFWEMQSAAVCSGRPPRQREVEPRRPAEPAEAYV